MELLKHLEGFQQIKKNVKKKKKILTGKKKKFSARPTNVLQLTAVTCLTCGELMKHNVNPSGAGHLQDCPRKFKEISANEKIRGCLEPLDNWAEIVR
jgi:hypothetical protein